MADVQGVPEFDHQAGFVLTIKLQDFYRAGVNIGGVG